MGNEYIAELQNWPVSIQSRDRLSRLSLQKQKRSTKCIYQNKTVAFKRLAEQKQYTDKDTHIVYKPEKSAPSKKFDFSDTKDDFSGDV